MACTVPPEAFPPPPQAVNRILHRLRRGGFQAYLCGGCVRDALLGGIPTDWDITTDATPEEIEGLFPRTVGVGRAFGVMLVVEGDESFEVATFRSDSPAGDGRRPAGVTFTTAEEDVKRRDLTVNGLLFDPESRRIIDHVGGVDDLKAGIIRTIGEPSLRFREDHLRLLRAVRFTANLGFSLAKETHQAIRTMAGLVRLVSAERQAEELTKLLTRGHAGRGLHLLFDTYLAVHLIPELLPMQGMPQPVEFHPEGDVLIHTAMMLDALPKDPDPALAWAVLLHDVGKADTLSLTDRIRFHHHEERSAQMAVAILTRLKRPNALIEQVETLIGQHMRFSHLAEMRRAKRRQWLRQTDFPLHLELHRLDCEASHGKMEMYTLARDARVEEEAIPELETPMISGRALIAMGYPPGPAFTPMLQAVEEARLEGLLKDEEEARAFLLSRYPRP